MLLGRLCRSRSCLQRLALSGPVLALLSLPAWGSAVLVLEDDQRLTGRSVELKDDAYLLEIGPGQFVTIPAGLVKAVNLIAESGEAPTGMNPAKAEILAGPPEAAHIPGREEQIRAFGRPAASFSVSVISPLWQPTDAFANAREAKPLLPTRWYRAPVSSLWQPVSAFTAGGDVTEFSPAHWYKGGFDTIWRPRDSWGTKEWFPPVTSRRESSRR